MSEMDRISDFLKDELYRTFCGKQLGAGMGSARAVFEHKLDPTLVIKFEYFDSGTFQNVIEWDVWNRVKHCKDIAKWFAPCVAISPNGNVLIQRRTTPAAHHPEKVPAFFCDLKCANFGILVEGKPEEGYLQSARKGQFVCHDYGTNLLLEKGMTKRMVNADWWNL